MLVTSLRRLWFRRLIIAATFAGAVVPLFAAEPAEEEYLIGLARVDVTPATPIRMSGYGARLSESEGVEQPLWAKALAVRPDKASQPVVLITVDTLGIPQAMTDAVAARLKEKHGLPRANLAICASHTHTGPIVRGVAPLILTPPTPAEELEHIDRYTAELTEKLGDVAELAIADLRPGRLAFAVGEAKFAMNRRKLVDGKWTGFGDVPEGAVDHSLPVLFVFEPGTGGSNPGSKLRGVLINYACHCTTLGGAAMKLHGDWAGCFQEQWEREHPGTTALVSIGCGADANPTPRSKDDYGVPRQHGDELVREVQRLCKEARFTPLAGPIAAKLAAFDLPLGPLPTRAEFEARLDGKGPIVEHAKVNLARLDRGETLPTVVPYSAQSWSFGRSLAMVFLPGEVVVGYQLRLKRELDAERLWVNAYANDDPCYVVTQKLLAEGGYEVDNSMYYYDRPQHFAPEVEETLVDAVHRVVPDEFKGK